MPFPMKIQPIDSQTYRESNRYDVTAKPVSKSRLKRLFDRQFPSVLKISLAEKAAAGEPAYGKDVATEFEPSSVCLAKMVQNFIEETNEKQSAAKCGRNRCNCFNGNNNDSSDDEFDLCSSGFGDSFMDFCDTLKSLVPCTSVSERNILADTSKIVEKNKLCKQKDELIKIVTDSLLALGYDASICKSRWEKSPSYPAGEYEYIDAIVEEERLLIDIEFRSEFEIARPTVNYKAILQSLPYIFVGRPDRLEQIVSMVSEAAKLSLKKRGMHIPPWRKTEYMRGKWLSPHTRALNDAVKEIDDALNNDSSCGDFDLIFREGATSFDGESSPARISVESKNSLSPWQPPAIKPKSIERGTKVVVTGLASLFKDKP
ncbi:hypothetical protein LguiA_001278 [Lonicera macranthoides]